MIAAAEGATAEVDTAMVIGSMCVWAGIVKSDAAGLSGRLTGIESWRAWMAMEELREWSSVAIMTRARSGVRSEG